MESVIFNVGSTGSILLALIIMLACLVLTLGIRDLSLSPGLILFLRLISWTIFGLAAFVALALLRLNLPLMLRGML